jgi:hypothetical protein
MHPYQTQTYKGQIQFGNYTGDTWYGISEYNHPLLLNNVWQVVSKPELFEGFELYIVGGILEGWLTWDIDWAVVGPYQPEKIKPILDWITEVGFKVGLYPDVTYAETLMDLHEWQKTGICEDRWIWRNSNSFSKNGAQPKNLSNYEPIDGLWRYWQPCPFQKNLDMDAKGHKYKKPVKIL